MNEETKRSCVDCGVYNCHTRDKEYPDFCLTTELTDEERAEVWKLYEEPENQKASVYLLRLNRIFTCDTLGCRKSWLSQNGWAITRSELPPVWV